MKIIECDQGSPEWFRARMGIPTASMFATVMAKGKNGGKSLTRESYMHKLAGEILTGEPMENYSNADMGRGKAAGAGETIDADQVVTLRAKLELTKAGETKLLSLMKLERLEDMPAKDYDYWTEQTEKAARK